MESNLNYLAELLESMRAATKPVDETDESIVDNWKEVFRVLKELQEAKEVDTTVNSEFEAVVDKFRRLVRSTFPDAHLIEDKLVKDNAFVFAAGPDKEPQYVVFC